MLKKFLYIFCLFFIYFNSLSNQLLKIFHHIGQQESKVSIYFKKEPIVILPDQKQEKKKLCQRIYLIKNCLISKNKETKEMLNLFNKFEHPFYKVTIQQSTDGVKLIFLYDCLNVKKIDLFSFDAISLFNGLSFNIEHGNVRGSLKKIPLPAGKILNSKKPNVVIDMGHGGTDFGAIGINKKSEKEITFEVGMKLKFLLEKKGYNVFLTRVKDEFVSLDKRTSMSNFLTGKTIFISIHANHSENERASGLETFYADSSLLNKINFINNYQVCSKYIDKIKNQSNYEIGKIIHGTLISQLKKVNKSIIDRKLKKSISQVLLGSQVPTVLIELGFLSNNNECKLLSSNSYQQKIAQAVAEAIDKYFANSY